MSLLEIKKIIQYTVGRLLEAKEAQTKKKVIKKAKIKPKNNPCSYCGSTDRYVGPETGGWESCAKCGSI